MAESEGSDVGLGIPSDGQDVIAETHSATVESKVHSSVIRSLPPPEVAKDSSWAQEVCMKQAARLEEMHQELQKAKEGESAARQALQEALAQHECERAEFGDKLEQMASLQAELQQENELLLSELESALGRTEAVKSDMAWMKSVLLSGEGQGQPGSPQAARPLQGCGAATPAPAWGAQGCASPGPSLSPGSPWTVMKIPAAAAQSPPVHAFSPPAPCPLLLPASPTAPSPSGASAEALAYQSPGVLPSRSASAPRLRSGSTVPARRACDVGQGIAILGNDFPQRQILACSARR
eukprot:TRINITY_DN109528_c0_g1_i1.p1 TRINITY_DN109528_c0_g1~~TRINITY_DN109528_c0_g1_i1.p1  ORF type:complete len:294 (-),score=67.43 TRINITY_DN109528_c0_g1_i1:13-894(-)